METLQLSMDQLMGVIKTLPVGEKIFLKSYIEKEIEMNHTPSSLTLQLLSGPVMSDEQYNSYLKLKQDFNKWSRKLFLLLLRQ
jgi:hypothetical protein